MWRVQDLKVAATDESRGPFVGRDAEPGLFAGAVGACSKTGNGQAVLVRGEAGIGKSRLVEEFMRIADDHGFASHRGLILDFGVAKQQEAVRALVRSLLDIPAGAGRVVFQTAAEAGFEAGLSGGSGHDHAHRG